MPSLIQDDDRQTVKRVVPKASNKILAVAIAKLYVAYPDRQRWTYTGLQGAAVLANDTVGNTFWIKLVDISSANRGVIWDQEIYDTFSYNQDRVFFHSFELEQCMAGLSFVDDKEAKKFKQKMDERESKAHKNTKGRPFGSAAGQQVNGAAGYNKPHSRLGGFGSLLHGHRHTSGTQPQQSNQTIIPPRDSGVSNHSRDQSRDSTLENIDPVLLDELLAMGITEDQLADNADYIKSYVQSRNESLGGSDRRGKPPPPPAPISPQSTGGSRRGPPPAPPPARRTKTDANPDTSTSPPRSDSPPAIAPTKRSFRAPPALVDAGKFANDKQSGRNRAQSNTAHPGPPPPPRPPKEAIDESEGPSKFGVPPPFEGDRSRPPPPPARNQNPPAPPARGPVPPPPPARDTSHTHTVPPATAAVAPPPLPPKQASSSPAPPPLPPTRNQPNSTPHPPPLPPGRDASVRAVPAPPPPPATSASGPPPPPPMPSTSSGPPPPPPMPSSGGPPPPPPMPNGLEPATANAPSMPKATGGRENVMADIRGGAKLKKVSDAEKNDRSEASVGGSGGGGGGSSAAPAAAAAGGGGLAGALESALAARKAKVSHSGEFIDQQRVSHKS
ncbi:MAG: hypothetical protein M1828_002614 [Chrysothrix sp. TS-e1954]|nr:MAG: hypothetical protein M1828_002614 [Chrysothrix sp. TS-e1954]